MSEEPYRPTTIFVDALGDDVRVLKYENGEATILARLTKDEALALGGALTALGSRPGYQPVFAACPSVPNQINPYGPYFGGYRNFG